MAFLFSIQDFERTLTSDYGQPVLQIFVDIAGEDGALVMFSLIMSTSSIVHLRKVPASSREI